MNKNEDQLITNMNRYIGTTFPGFEQTEISEWMEFFEKLTKLVYRKLEENNKIESIMKSPVDIIRDNKPIEAATRKFDFDIIFTKDETEIENIANKIISSFESTYTKINPYVLISPYLISFAEKRFGLKTRGYYE